MKGPKKMCIRRVCGFTVNVLSNVEDDEDDDKFYRESPLAYKTIFLNIKYRRQYTISSHEFPSLQGDFCDTLVFYITGNSTTDVS